MCVCGWMAEKEILSSASLTGVRVSRGIPLSTLSRSPHKELCPRKPARPEKRINDVVSQESDSEGFSLKFKPRTRGCEVRSMTLSGEDEDQMSQHLW